MRITVSPYGSSVHCCNTVSLLEFRAKLSFILLKTLETYQTNGVEGKSNITGKTEICAEWNVYKISGKEYELVNNPNALPLWGKHCTPSIINFFIVFLHYMIFFIGLSGFYNVDC